MRNIILFVLVAVVMLSACTDIKKEATVVTDPLPSWNEVASKTAIIDFVNGVIDVDSEHFVPVPDRIAVFDNDGNLWSEKPLYFQFFFAMDRINALVTEHPEWHDQQPFKAVIEHDMDEIKKFGMHELLEIVMASHAGISTEEFEAIVKDWLSTSRHPRFDRPYTDLVYQPMLELLSYLKANEFKVFIVSGGGIEFIRPWAEEVYDIPRDQVVGSSIKTEFVIGDDGPVIMRHGEIDFIDDKEGKPVGIHKHIGRKPIFCSGNSDGDLAMMQYTASGNGSRFMLYLHHTDDVREWAYDRDSPVGRLNKGLVEAEAGGWTVIDMKQDWKIIYPFQIEE